MVNLVWHTVESQIPFPTCQPIRLLPSIRIYWMW
jgi:hypothetical protein